MAWTRHDIERLFYSSETVTGGGRGPRGLWPESYEELARFLNDGWIIAEVSPYVATAPTEPLYTETYDRLMRTIGNESRAHKQLKWEAWIWLRQEGDPWPQFELSTIFGRADVASVSLEIAAECGDTSPDKVADALAHGWKALTLWPFDQAAFFIFRLSKIGAVELLKFFEQRLFEDNAAAEIGL